MKYLKATINLFAIVCIFAGLLNAQIASGGQFTLNQSVIASGGGPSSGDIFTVNGTSGQLAAGQPSSNLPLTAQAGFWNFVTAVPGVSVGGIVQTEDGHGVRNIRLTLTASDNSVKTVLTGSSGFYRFDDVTPGQIYTIRAYSRRFRIAQAIRVVSVSGAIADMNFVALE